MFVVEKKKPEPFKPTVYIKVHEDYCIVETSSHGTLCIINRDDDSFEAAEKVLTALQLDVKVIEAEEPLKLDIEI